MCEDELFYFQKKLVLRKVTSAVTFLRHAWLETVNTHSGMLDGGKAFRNPYISMKCRPLI